MVEATLLNAALVAYVAGWVTSWRRDHVPALVVAADVAATARDVRSARHASHAALAWIMVAIVLHTISLAWRWSSLGHGPFTTMYEILSSSLWSLSLVVAATAVFSAQVRASIRHAFPVTAVLASWMLMADPSPGHLPATYATVLLYLHTIVGKLYLGLLLVAVAVAIEDARRDRVPRREGMQALVHRLAGFALVFDTLLLIVGAVWAQDAWGRYWAWDPLETWSFLTWLALIATLHARVTYRPSPRVLAACLSAVFALAFLTFFGVPYLSTAPHKGAI